MPKEQNQQIMTGPRRRQGYSGDSRPPGSSLTLPMPHSMSRARLLILCCCAALLATPVHGADEVVAVASKVARDYVRKKLPDGTFQPETYAFGKGDSWGGARVDETVDKMDFMDVARVLAVSSVDYKGLRRGWWGGREGRATNLLGGWDRQLQALDAEEDGVPGLGNWLPAKQDTILSHLAGQPGDGGRTVPGSAVRWV